jgi:pimeloyl-ACP methyl ester carboxylesterase
MNAIDVACGKLCFEDVQPAKGEPLATILLVHGAGGSRLSWRRQIGEFSKQFRVVVPDLPGHGMSEGEGEASVEAYARFVQELIGALQLRNVVLGGHSMGGAIALTAALQSSNTISALILSGSAAKLRVLPAVFSLIRDDFALAVEGISNFLFGPTAPKELIEEQRQLVAKNSTEVLLKDYTACDSYDVRNDLGSITVPTLILCGTKDRLVPATESRFLYENIRGSEIAIFEDCGHMLTLEQSDAFNCRVISFITELMQRKAESGGKAKTADDGDAHLHATL